MAKKNKVNMEKDQLEKLKEEHARLRSEGENQNSEISAETKSEENATIEEPKKRRGRPKGSKNKPKDGSPQLDITQVIPEPICIAVIQAPYLLAAKKYGDHWLLTEEEAKTMVMPHLELARRYLPDYFTNYPEIWAVCILHSLAIIARMQLEMKIRQEENVKQIFPVEPINNVEQSINDTGETRLGKIYTIEPDSEKTD